MNVIDENGRLFGRVNVYDALVVLLVLGAIVAGVVFLDPLGGGDSAGGNGGESATRYATVDLGNRSPAVAERITDGTTSAPDLTITDTYVGPADGENLSVVVRVRIDGTLTDGEGSDGRSITFADTRVQRGSDLDIETAEYDVAGEVLELSTEGETLNTSTLPVLIRADLGPSTAALVDRGDTYRIDGRTMATVEQAVVNPRTNRTNRTDLVGLSLRTIRYDGATYFGADRVLVDRPLEFRTDRYAFSGTVARWGNASLPGEPVERTVTVRAANVPPHVADRIEAGIVERRGNATIARVMDVRTEPASVVLTSADGNIYEREHPRNEDVFLTVELRARSTGDDLRFRTRRVRAGTTLSLDFDTVSVVGEVLEVQ
ncbi:DUF4330 domain-containing protein [Natrinema sp. CBA1119]|uniref:DUF4330 domain-containing protein n=1 Tax=Natrinema sp. CBA1119 TaxID=1608465 RepID=UPI00159B8884|nr:DUF4330 domain-containing protein [Natrinema sp. CBA1119]